MTDYVQSYYDNFRDQLLADLDTLNTKYRSLVSHIKTENSGSKVEKLIEDVITTLNGMKDTLNTPNPSESKEEPTSMPEPADGETVTKTTVSKSKGGVGDALRKAVEGVGGLSEDEEESGDEDNMDMSDEGAGNLLKVLQNKF